MIYIHAIIFVIATIPPAAAFAIAGLAACLVFHRLAKIAFAIFANFAKAILRIAGGIFYAAAANALRTLTNPRRMVSGVVAGLILAAGGGFVPIFTSLLLIWWKILIDRLDDAIHGAIGLYKRAIRRIDVAVYRFIHGRKQQSRKIKLRSSNHPQGASLSTIPSRNTTTIPPPSTSTPTAITVRAKKDDRPVQYKWISDNVPSVLPRNDAIHLPPSSNPARKTLVLDLDETLIHSSLDHMPQTRCTFKTIQVEGRTLYVVFRPHVLEFLRWASARFEVVVFTAGIQSYANAVVRMLDPLGVLVHHVLARDACFYHNGVYVKDLRVLGRDLSKVVMVENRADVLGFQPDNGIVVPSFYDDPNDDILGWYVKGALGQIGDGTEDVRACTGIGIMAVQQANIVDQIGIGHSTSTTKDCFFIGPIQPNPRFIGPIQPNPRFIGPVRPNPRFVGPVRRVRWADGYVNQVDFVLRDPNKAFSADEEDAARDESNEEEEHFQTHHVYYAWLNDMNATKIAGGPFAGRLGYVIETDSAIFTDVRLVGSDAVELIRRAHIEEGWCGHAVQVAEEDVNVGRLEAVEEKEEDVPLLEEAVEEEEEVLVVGLDGDVVNDDDDDDDDDDEEEEEEEDQRAVRIIGGTYAGESCYIQEQLSVMVRIKLVGSGKVTCIMPRSLEVEAEQEEEAPAVQVPVPIQVEVPIVLRRSPRLAAKRHR